MDCGCYRTSRSDQGQDRQWPQQNPEPMQRPIASVGTHGREYILGQTKIQKAAYFNAVETDPKVVLRFEPAPFTTLMIMTEIDAAMRPYSTAVAPDSSFRKARICPIIAKK
jgi:hypothetical protein